MPAWSPAAEQRLVDYIRHKVTAQASGDIIRHPITREVTDCLIGARPKDKFFVGQLRGQPDPEADSSRAEYRSKVSPSSLALRFKLDSPDATISAAVRAHVFYRVVPTLEEQNAAYRRSDVEDESLLDVTELAGEDDSSEPDEARKIKSATSTGKGGRERLARVYRRLTLEVDELPLVARDGYITSESLETANEVIHERLEHLKKTARGDPRLFGIEHADLRLESDLLADESAYEAAVLVSADQQEVEWKIALYAERSTLGGQPVNLIGFSNESPDDANADVTENSVFSPHLDLRINGARLRPFEFLAVPDDFRHERIVWAQASNCSFEVSEDRAELCSTHSPTFHQNRYLPSDEFIDAPLDFAELGARPFPVLEALVASMEKYAASTWEPKLAEHGPGSIHHETVLAAGEAFKTEVTRVRRGIDALRANPDLLASFQMMNASMAAAAAGQGYSTWRTFQLAFILTQIQEVGASAMPAFRQDSDCPGKTVFDTVDIIYFPTGGGKTECYLGLVVMHALFDRLRGKTSGPTAWARFPLRLLGLQQFQRILRTMHYAEKQRRKHNLGGDPFSVGLLVGSGSTPNKLDDETLKRLSENPQDLEAYRFVYRCPECGEDSVGLTCDVANARIRSTCGNKQCGAGELAVYVSDEEVYRYTPTVLVGTIDKLATASFQANFSTLLGYATHRCPKHGVTLKGKCLHRGCKSALESLDEDEIPTAPSLLVQDELHLLRESLGTFDSHYEGMLRALVARSPRPVDMKVIGATATIERFEEQCRHLYLKDARRFPEDGPTLGSSFYAETKRETRRMFVGLLPFGVTHIQAMMDLLYFYHREIQLLSKGSGEPWKQSGLEDLGEANARELLLTIEPSLSYFTSKTEADRVSTSIEAQVDVYLQDEGLEPLLQQSMTGETEFDQVNRALENLEEPPEAFSDRIQAVTATSMVSHGVDVARLNFMAFYGMPKVNAEYVQSSSRVGRNYTGLVVCLYRPSRERDRSHFHLHSKYHEFLDRLIEPVAINRWSRFSIERTLPGLVSAYFVCNIQPQVYGKNKSMQMATTVRDAINRGKVTLKGLREFLFDCYGGDDEVFTEEIKVLTAEIMSRLETPPKALERKRVLDILRAPGDKQHRLVVMRSLRDTDATVMFGPLQNTRRLLSELNQ